MRGLYSTDQWIAGGQQVYESYCHLINGDPPDCSPWAELTVSEQINWQLVWLSTVTPHLLSIQTILNITESHESKTVRELIRELNGKGLMDF